MTEPKSFLPVKLICGLIFSAAKHLQEARHRLIELYGNTDLESPIFPFDWTDYYNREMGNDLKRIFFSFLNLIRPEQLPMIKLQTNSLETELGCWAGKSGRVVNIDPGYITSSALIMATAKNFSHRVPLDKGIYAHLEFIFSKDKLKFFDWTYPDFKREPGYRDFFLRVRTIYLKQIKI